MQRGNSQQKINHPFQKLEMRRWKQAKELKWQGKSLGSGKKAERQSSGAYCRENSKYTNSMTTAGPDGDSRRPEKQKQAKVS